jgi:type IV secretory pathway TraG/TraD family ATPase VirD4
MNKKPNNDLDLITPLVEIFHELTLLLSSLTFELVKHLFGRVLDLKEPIKKIDSKKLSCKKNTLNKESLGINTRNKKEVYLKDIDFGHHSFIVGASGFGKTNLMTIIQEEYLRRGRPIVFIDPKGDLEALTNFKTLCESFGKECLVFSEAHKDSIKLNPILDGTISQVVDRVISSFEWTEPFYEAVSTRALRAALKSLDRENKNFSYKNIYDTLISRHDSKDIQGLISYIEAIVESDFGPYLDGGQDDYTFKKIREQGACLYIGVPTQGYGKMAMGLGKLFVNEIMFNSYEIQSKSNDSKANKENPIAVFFDEFGSLVTPRFIELENKCRGAGIDLTISIQSLADINRVNRELKDQILESCGNWFILKQRVATHASYLSESIGTILTKKETHQTEDGQKSGMGTEKEVHELIAHPDLIKRLSIGQCILLEQTKNKITLVNIRKFIRERYKDIKPIKIHYKEEAFNE